MEHLPLQKSFHLEEFFIQLRKVLNVFPRARIAFLFHIIRTWLSTKESDSKFTTNESKYYQLMELIAIGSLDGQLARNTTSVSGTDLPSRWRKSVSHDLYMPILAWLLPPCQLCELLEYLSE